MVLIDLKARMLLPLPGICCCGPQLWTQAIKPGAIRVHIHSEKVERDGIGITSCLEQGVEQRCKNRGREGCKYTAEGPTAKHSWR